MINEQLQQNKQSIPLFDFDFFFQILPIYFSNEQSMLSSPPTHFTKFMVLLFFKYQMILGFKNLYLLSHEFLTQN